jgi:hypothetical protein
MSCEQIRQRVEDSQDRDLDLRSFSAEMLAHLNVCAECKHFIGQRRELALSLRRVRESAPEVPTTLDAAVLRAFRKRVAAPRREPTVLHETTHRVAIFSYSAALLAVAAVILILLLPGRKLAPRIETVQAPQPIVANELPASLSRSAPEGAIKQARLEAHKKLDQHISRRGAIADNYSLLPSGFTSLMYCDRLSCAGDMEIVRVQLSPSMLGLPPGQTDAAETVRADVVVGADGIARGIRLDQ